jgi:hypothetical protein
MALLCLPITWTTSLYHVIQLTRKGLPPLLRTVPIAIADEGSELGYGNWIAGGPEGPLKSLDPNWKLVPVAHSASNERPGWNVYPLIAIEVNTADQGLAMHDIPIPAGPVKVVLSGRLYGS